jgi:hypothetical protein
VVEGRKFAARKSLVLLSLAARMFFSVRLDLLTVERCKRSLVFSIGIGRGAASR